MQDIINLTKDRTNFCEIHEKLKAIDLNDLKEKEICMKKYDHYTRSRILPVKNVLVFQNYYKSIEIFNTTVTDEDLMQLVNMFIVNPKLVVEINNNNIASFKAGRTDEQNLTTKYIKTSGRIRGFAYPRTMTEITEHDKCTPETDNFCYDDYCYDYNKCKKKHIIAIKNDYYDDGRDGKFYFGVDENAEYDEIYYFIRKFNIYPEIKYVLTQHLEKNIFVLNMMVNYIIIILILV